MTEISHIMNNAKISQILSFGVGYLNVIVIREMSLLCCRFCQELHNFSRELLNKKISLLILPLTFLRIFPFNNFFIKYQPSIKALQHKKGKYCIQSKSAKH